MKKTQRKFLEELQECCDRCGEMSYDKTFSASTKKLHQDGLITIDRTSKSQSIIKITELGRKELKKCQEI